jgi:hypothetical protein
MMAVLSVWRWIAGAREWLVLFAVAAAAAWFYVDARQVRADRDAWASWGDQVCAFAGAGTAPATVEIQTDKGPRKVEKPRGQLCAEAVQDLAAFKARSQTESARLLAEAQREREQKAAVDRAASHSDAADRRAAQAKMEEVDAQVGDDDRVGSDWFARLNELAGLRGSR